MGKIVIFSDEVSDKLDEIAEILYPNQFFGFVEDADHTLKKSTIISMKILTNLY